MDLFEFILIITSVIFALAVAQILSGISRVAQSTTAIRYYFPHAFIFLIWWASWEFRDIQWTFPGYAYMLIAPTLLYFSCSLLIPQQINDENADLEMHFFRIRRPLFASYFLAALTVMVDGNLLSDEAIWHSGRYGQAAVLVAAVWAFATKSKRAHTVISIMSMLAFLVLIITRFWNPR